MLSAGEVQGVWDLQRKPSAQHRRLQMYRLGHSRPRGDRWLPRLVALKVRFGSN
jgi:hypothetical protein